MIFQKAKSKKQKVYPTNRRANFGFTLIELIVVIAIMGIMSSIILFNYNGFNSSVSLDNLSQDIALTIRKAQVSTIGINGVNVTSNGATTRYFPSYGLHFSLPSNSTSSNPTDGSEKSFIYFADLETTPGLRIYNQTDAVNCGEDYLSTSTTSPNECLDIVNIAGADRISEICITSGSNNTLNCYDSSLNNPSPAIDIAFTRPDPEAYFNCTLNGAQCVPNGIFSATIKIKSTTTGKTKSITVWNTGQISVN